MAPEQDTASGLMLGVIHDVFAHTSAYQVRTTGGGIRQATALHDGSATTLGARPVSHYSIGTPVLCYFAPQCSYGYILGAAPTQVFDSRLVLPDSLVLSSMVGFFYDQMHYAMYGNDKLNLANFSGGRPLDALQGDWGRINELGVAIWLGKLMAQVRASDIAKLECFWGDDLVRLFAWNYQRYTAGLEHFAFDDEGEYSEVEFWSPFVWEALGSYEPGKEVFKESTSGISRGNEDSRYEPKEGDKQAFVPRGLHLRGYLGDGVRELHVLAPPDKTGIAKVDDEEPYRGVLEIHKGLDGHFSVRSAAGILLEKSLMLPVPRRKKDPDDPSGDTGVGSSANYKPANQYGSGPTQEKKPYKWPEGMPPERALNLPDYDAYLGGKFGLQALDAHAKDWKTPEQSDVKIDSSNNNEVDKDTIKCGGDGLKFKCSADLPKSGSVTVDPRQGHEVKYYQSRAAMQILDDGSVSIEDAYGSQILLSGGNIYLSCPGDIFARPGRNFIAWAPRDFIAKAGWCAEISAAKRDVRIKAEQNLHVLAGGTDKKGSILIECRADKKPSKSAWTGKYGEDIESSGIVIKAVDSAVDIWSKKVFVGATKEASGVVEISSGLGQTVIDGGSVGIEATKKFGVLVGSSRSKSSNPGQLVMDESSVKLVAKLDMVGDLGVWAGSKGSGQIKCDSSIASKGSIGAAGSIYCAGGIAANGVQSTSSHNGLGGGRSPSVSSQGGATENAVGDAKEPFYQDFEQDTQDDASEGAANKEVWDAIGFSFRDSEKHYKTTEDYYVFESRAQQLYRAFGLGKPWEEPAVAAPDGTETRPHPGQIAWTSSLFRKAPDSPKNIDMQTGVPKARSSQSEEGQEPTDGSLQSDYLVTVQKPD